MKQGNEDAILILRQKRAEKLAKRDRDAARFKLAVCAGLGLLLVLGVTLGAWFNPPMALPVATAANTTR